MGSTQKKPSNTPDTVMIDEILHNYVEMERATVSQLFFKYKNHGTTIGGFREDIWKELFIQFIPKKFVVEQSVFIIDSAGQVSHEVDLAILDEMYTPYIFRKGRLKFIPIEAVAVAVECKSLSANEDSLKNWTNSIKNLKTSRQSIARMHSYVATGGMDNKPQTQTATRPILIYCCLDHKHSKNMEHFDFTLQADYDSCQIHVHRNSKLETLADWYRALNHNGSSEEMIADCSNRDSIDDYKIHIRENEEKREVSLLSFNFQLNQLLMLINNPMLFPHKAYVDMFNKKFSEKRDEESGS
ncbi:DUF6602 domain-containing protein [Paenibacillus chitinolyticus]|uniref:DUF6602 domain-containing protein n=1 Tax=Paenibacillus chitinolyticus TaxID=79263 RepID=UPI003667496A